MTSSQPPHLGWMTVSVISQDFRESGLYKLLWKLWQGILSHVHLLGVTIFFCLSKNLLLPSFLWFVHPPSLHSFIHPSIPPSFHSFLHSGFIKRKCYSRSLLSHALDKKMNQAPPLFLKDLNKEHRIMLCVVTLQVMGYQQPQQQWEEVETRRHNVPLVLGQPHLPEPLPPTETRPAQVSTQKIQPLNGQSHSPIC